MATRPNTPDIPAEQLLAVVGGSVGLAVSLGVPLDPGQAEALQTYVLVQGPTLVGAGAWIRTTRARHWDKLSAGDPPEPHTRLAGLRRPDLLAAAGLGAVAIALSATALILVLT